MKPSFRLLIILSLTLFIVSCEFISGLGPCDATGPVIIYKTKHDYFNNLTVKLSKNKTIVLAYPAKQDADRQRPVRLANGYLFKRMVGDAYLSLTIDEYVNSTKEYSSADFLNLIMDTDPYLEKYECCECTGNDTAMINNLIRTNELKKCSDSK